MCIYNIRDFEINDEELFDKMAQLFYESEAAHNKANKEFIKNTFLNCVNKSPFVRGIFFCCDSEVYGYALLTFSYSNEYGGKIMEIDEIYIQDKFRKKGLAKKLITLIISEYKNDIVYVSVVVRKDNERAIKLFEKSGFYYNDYLSMYKILFHNTYLSP